jgi:hypothetical protein
MPYDLTLTVVNPGNLEHTVVPARQNTPLTPDESEAVAEAGSIRDYQAELRPPVPDQQDTGATTRAPGIAA